LQERAALPRQHVHGACKKLVHATGRLFPIAPQQARWLCEASPEVGMEGSGGYEGFECAERDYRILGPHRSALESRFDVVDVGRQQSIAQRRKRVSMGLSIAFNEQVEIDQPAFIAAATQATSVKEDCQGARMTIACGGCYGMDSVGGR